MSIKTKLLAFVAAFSLLAAPAQADSMAVAGATFQNAPNFFAAVKSIFAGTASGVPARLCADGDSTTFGVGSQATGASGLQTLSYPAQIAQSLNNYGVPAHFDAFMGDQGTAQTLANDSRMTIGSSWTQQTGSESIGGAQLKASTSTNPVVFAPVNAVDTFRIFYIAGGSGTFSWKIDAGSATNQSQSSGSGLQSITVSAGSPGVHAISISEVSGTVNIQGIEGYDSTNPSVSIINAGWSGSNSGNWAVTTNAQSPGNAAPYAALGCTTLLINLGINNENGTGYAGGPSGTKADITTLINAGKAAGADVLVIVPHPIAIGTTAQATQLTYANAIKQAAAAAGVPVVSLYDKFGSQAQTIASGVAFDALHLSALGYSDVAEFIANALMPPGYPHNVYALAAQQQPSVNRWSYLGFMSATSGPSASADVGFTRGGAGIMACGTGARTSTTCTFQLAGIQFNTNGQACKTGAYTATIQDNFICVDATSAAVPITLPACTTGMYGQDLFVKKVDASANVVNIGNGTDTVDGVSGASAAPITTQNTTFHLRCQSSTKWMKLQ